MITDRLATAWGGPAGSGRLRERPEDFRVDEVLGFEPGGGGEHLWLWVRKRGANSEDVAAALAQAAAVRRRRVGYSGRKDRNAETRQWFSLHLPGAADPEWPAAGADRWEVERAVRHPRKLRTGTHRANAFRLRVRGFEGDRAMAEARLAAIARAGFPNYFGPQRFGREGENLKRARTALTARGRRPSGIQLSAARSWLFNLVLDRRVADGSWCRALPDDAMMLAGTHSVFRCRGDEPDLESRLAAHDLDPTGPMCGRGEAVAGPAAIARERAWLEDEAALLAALEDFGVTASRRALRAHAPDLEWSWDGDDLWLAFSLPRGAFATSLLREVVQT
ncbi:MAG: tRNA pseudouridine(13) synthase TruD [Halofilum sp. (in: g-proteobacteria)]|nr:tRNA pseudouridine(13) synthase TruD [Halofilum sp. (in: g-proteobacteria)]